MPSGGSLENAGKTAAVIGAIVFAVGWLSKRL